MPASDSIYKLIENFECNLAYHKSARYNEKQACVEFINPFFEVGHRQHARLKRWPKRTKRLELHIGLRESTDIVLAGKSGGDG